MIYKKWWLAPKLGTMQNKVQKICKPSQADKNFNIGDFTIQYLAFGNNLIVLNAIYIFGFGDTKTILWRCLFIVQDIYGQQF